MGAIDKDRHRPWLAYALEEALRRSLFSAKDVVVHANPEVLVSQLPHQVICELFARALASGTFSAAHVIETAPPALLAEYLEPDVMWRCLNDVAERGNLSKKSGARSDIARQWLANVLQRALDSELVSPADLMRSLPPSEFVANAPRPVVAELIKAGLSRGTFDAALVLQHLTPTVIAENLDTTLVWGCVAEAVTRHFELGGLFTRAEEVTNVTPPPTRIGPKPVDKTADRRPLAPAADKMSAASLGPKPAGGGTISGRIETSPPRHPSAPPARADANEWRTADDLDVLEEEPLPGSLVGR